MAKLQAGKLQTVATERRKSSLLLTVDHKLARGLAVPHPLGQVLRQAAVVLAAHPFKHQVSPSCSSSYTSITHTYLAGEASIPGRIQPEEIVAALQAGGISITKLTAMFKPRLNGPGQLTQKEFIQQIKGVAKYGADKLLRLK